MHWIDVKYYIIIANVITRAKYGSVDDREQSGREEDAVVLRQKYDKRAYYKDNYKLSL